MTTEKGLGPVKRFGVRYGRTVKFKLAQVEKKQKKLQYCPYCNKEKAKKIAMGIFECRKCNAKFTGKAFFNEKKVIAGSEEVPEEEKLSKKEEEAEA